MIKGFVIHRFRRSMTILSLVIPTIACAESWPTYRHDARRSAVTGDRIVFPMKSLWVRKSNQPPQTAWTGPAKWDAYSGNSGLQSMRNFDPCFYVTAADDRIYYGSSVDDAVHAIDAETGTEQWVYFTGSAVRFPPTLSDRYAYFGSDDGWVYCCDRFSGDLEWRFQAAPEIRFITSNRKIISMWPVRTAVLVGDGKVCFGASLVPWEKSYLCTVDAATGDLNQPGCFRVAVDEVTLQGALLASDQTLYAPQGRSAPLAFVRATGASLGAVGEAGGVFCVLTEDEMLLAGPKDQKSPDDQIRVADPHSKQHLASFGGANRVLIDGDQAWIPMAGKLKRLNRSEHVAGQVAAAQSNRILNDKASTESQKIDAQKNLDRALARQNAAWNWEVECPAPAELIKTVDAIIVGLENEVRAYSADDGRLRWSVAVDGVAHGLTVADGRLFVSTGKGHLYAFGSQR